MAVFLFIFIAWQVIYLLYHKEFCLDNELGNIDIVGRFFSAFFSTLTIILYIFWLKKFLIKNRIPHNYSLCFYCYIYQTAHYGVTESLITLIGVSLCLFSILFLEKASWLLTLILAVILGIGVASKTSAIIFIVIPFLHIYCSYWKKTYTPQRVSAPYFIFDNFLHCLYDVLSLYIS